MPGALVILNAVKSLQQFGPLRPLDWWVILVVQIMLILVMSYAFARLDSLRATVAVNLGVIAILGVTSFYLFRMGVWLEVAVPILGVQLYSFLDDFDEMCEALARRPPSA